MWLSSSIRNLSRCSERMGSLLLTARQMSRKRAVNVRKVNPKVPPQEAYSIARDLYDVIRSRGPLTVPNTWNQAQEAGVSGLKSKTHLKLMLKWMRGRKMLKLFCNPVGSSKKFLHCTLPGRPREVSFFHGMLVLAVFVEIMRNCLSHRTSIAYSHAIELTDSRILFVGRLAGIETAVIRK